MKSNQGFLTVGLALGMILLGIVSVVGVVGYVEYKKNNNLPQAFQATSTNSNQQNTATETAKIINNIEVLPIVNKAATSIVANNKTKPTDINIQNLSPDNLWPLYDLQTEAYKNADFEALNKVNYKQIPTQEFPPEPQRTQIMQFLYDQSIKTNKTSFVNKWYDDKQAIYSTEYKKIDVEGMLTYEIHRIIFAKDAKGMWKILGGGVDHTGYDMKDGNAQQELDNWIIDADKDGLLDADENCSIKKKVGLGCEIKTDANKRDTNGDGWWDGVGAEF